MTINCDQPMNSGDSNTELASTGLSFLQAMQESYSAAQDNNTHQPEEKQKHSLHNVEAALNSVSATGEPLSFAWSQATQAGFNAIKNESASLNNLPKLSIKESNEDPQAKGADSLKKMIDAFSNIKGDARKTGEVIAESIAELIYNLANSVERLQQPKHDMKRDERKKDIHKVVDNHLLSDATARGAAFVGTSADSTEELLSKESVSQEPDTVEGISESVAKIIEEAFRRFQSEELQKYIKRSDLVDMIKKVMEKAESSTEQKDPGRLDRTKSMKRSDLIDLKKSIKRSELVDVMQKLIER